MRSGVRKLQRRKSWKLHGVYPCVNKFGSNVIRLQKDHVKWKILAILWAEAEQCGILCNVTGKDFCEVKCLYLRMIKIQWNAAAGVN